VVTFTDGLLERRGEDIDVGQQRVLGALAELTEGTLEEQLEALMDRVRDHTRSDDVAVLALRHVAPPG
jgi:serine phosphatase RsbU (regulator of sigma subunit)